MSVIATAVRHLIAAGVGGEGLIQAIAEMEASIRAEPREPTASALRMRRLRERRQASQSVTCDGSDVTASQSVTEAPSLDKSPQTPKINPTPHVCGDAPARKAEKFPVPDGCDPNDWRDLLANRRAKRLPLTEAAYAKLLRDLAAQVDEDWPPGKVLRAAAERGWAAIFDPRESQGNRRYGNRPATDRPNEPINPMVRAGIAREARYADLDRAPG